jgi:hypothetical protein
MRSRWPAYAVASVALVAYVNTVFHEFVYDDDLTVAECPLIASWSNVGGLFTQDYFDQTIEMSWRPVATLTLFIDNSLSGDVAFIYHLFNVLWHVAASVALWWMLRTLLGGTIGPLVGAAMFAVHPVGSEAVNAISFREDLLVALFAALAVGSAVRLLRGEGRPRLLLAAVPIFYLMACLSKESGLSVVMIIGLWWWLAGAGERRAAKTTVLGLAATLLAATALYSLLRFRIIVPENPVAVPAWGGGVAAAVWNFPRIFFHGLALVFFPVGLAADHEWTAITTWREPRLWAGWIALLIWVTAIARCRRRAPILGLGLGWWLIALLPVSNVVPLSNPVADRYLYLPLMGAAVAVAWAVERGLATEALRDRGPRRLASAAVAVAGLLLLGITVNHNLIWGDAERLWTATLRVEPNSTTALNNLGCIRLQQGRPEEAAALLERGLSVATGDIDLVNNYGIAMVELGRWEEARQAFELSVAGNPDDRLAHWRLALCLTQSPTPDPARAWKELLIAERLGFDVPREFRETLRGLAGGEEAS